MGRKKKKPMKPWCWYCERDFEDDKVLVQHQKAKHFKCHVCHKKMYTAPGLVLHAMQVHKENITAIPNCLPNRNNLELEIVGMEGIPEEDMRAYREKKNYREDGASAPKRPAFDPASFIVPPIVPGLGGPPSFNSPPSFGIPPPQLTSPSGGPMMAGMPPLAGAPPLMPNLSMMPTANSSASVLAAPAGPALPDIPKPLFPSAQMTETTRPPPLMSFNPLEASAGTVAQAAPIASGGVPPTGKTMSGSATNRIVHPEEDISLEELRSCLAKYHRDLGSAQPPFIKQPINVAAELGPAYSNVAPSYQQY